MKNRILKTALRAITVLLLITVTGAAAGEEAPPAKGDVIAVEQAEKPAAQTTSASPATGEQIKWQVISSGATDGVSTNYALKGTIGQTAIGSGSSENFGLSHGYWQQTVSSQGCCEIRADVDHGGELEPNIADLVYLVTYMFQGGPEPPCDEPYSPGCLDHYFAEADIDGDGSCTPNIGDLVYLVSYMFQGGPPPVPCP